MHKSLLLIFVATTLVSAETPMPAPIHSFDWVIGRWECKGVTPAGKVDYTFWQQIERLPKSRWFRFNGASGTAFETYDTATHLWRYFDFNDSGEYSIGTAPDFVDNRQSWTGESYKDGVRRSWGRIVFQKVSDHEKREDFYKRGKNGKEYFDGSELCTKTR